MFCEAKIQEIMLVNHPDKKEHNFHSRLCVLQLLLNSPLAKKSLAHPHFVQILLLLRLSNTRGQQATVFSRHLAGRALIIILVMV